MIDIQPTTGIPEADRLVSEIRVGDNVIWEADSGAPVNKFVSGFISAYVEDSGGIARRAGAWIAYKDWRSARKRAVVMSPGESLLPSLLPSEILEYKRKSSKTVQSHASSELSRIRETTKSYCETSGDLAASREILMKTVEETVIRFALDRGMSQRDLSTQLGMSRMTLRKRMKEYGL